MEPTPGGKLEELYALMTNPDVQIVARLAQAPIVTDPDIIILADLTECNFPGYTPVPLTASLADADEDVGAAVINGIGVDFEAGTIVTPQRVTALYFTAQVTGQALRLVSVILFPSPLIVNRTKQMLSFDAFAELVEA